MNTLSNLLPFYLIKPVSFNAEIQVFDRTIIHRQDSEFAQF